MSASLLKNAPITEGGLRKVALETVQGKSTCLVTNVISSLKAPWVIMNKQVDWVSLVATPNQYNTSISLVTHHKNVKVAFSADSGSFPASKQLLDLIVSELKGNM